jgi:hypothetical protein
MIIRWLENAGVSVWNQALRMGHAFRYEFTIKGVDFYVAENEETRRALFDKSNYLAFTIGHTVYARSKRVLTAKIIHHELEHVEQYRREGVWSFWTYQKETRKKGYWKNQYERDAREAENRTQKHKRTVRVARMWSWLSVLVLLILLVSWRWFRTSEQVL